MSIETEFQSTIENVQNAYKGLANLGATIPQNKNIENISDCLDEIYGVLPKTSFQEGTEVTIEGGLKGKIDFDEGKVGFGQASQDSTQGYQILSLTNGSYSVSGITAKVQDGEITLNGTSTAQASIYIPIVDIPLVTTDKFSFAFNKDGDFPSGVGMYFTDSSKALIRWDFGQARLRDATNFFPQADATAHYFHIAVNTTGTSFSNFKLKPMFEKGATAHNWEQYTGGYASPSPNWEQPIQCVTGEQSIVESDGNNNSITYPISLGSLEFHKIGDYADELLYDVDEDRVYKNEKIGKVVLNGSENWAINKDKTYTFQFLVNSLISRANGSTSLMNMFYYKYGDPTDTTNENYFWIYNNQSLAIVIQKTIVSTLAEFKTWLGTNKPKLYYVLATATKIEITDSTLKQQVKNWYYGQSLNGTTIVTSEGNLPMVIKIRALKGE